MRITRSIVPNLFTLINLFMGFTAIVYASRGDLISAALFIFIAAIFDMLDGAVARLLKSASEFGVELDSLCDAVSFGLAPSYMLYKAYFYTYDDIGNIGILLASLPALAGVYRLARFNVKLTSLEDKKYFTGLPIPAGALTIITYLIFFHLRNIIPDDFKSLTIISVTILTSLVMVSKIKFDNLPRPSIRSIKQNPVIFSILVVAIIGTIVTKGIFVFPFMLFYIVASGLRHLVVWLKATPEAADDIDESEQDEPSPYEI